MTCLSEACILYTEFQRRGEGYDLESIQNDVMADRDTIGTSDPIRHRNVSHQVEGQEILDGAMPRCRH